MPNLLLRNDRGRAFVDVTAASGTGHLQKGHGVAFVDLDHDGDQDIVLNVGGAVPGDRYEDALFANPGVGGRHWVRLTLVGSRSNRAGIGARITVSVREGRGLRAIRREVTAGGSFGSNAFAQHIGLGQASVVQRLEVHWPVTGRTQTFAGVMANRAYRIREDRDVLEPVQTRQFALAHTGAEQP